MGATGSYYSKNLNIPIRGTGDFNDLYQYLVYQADNNNFPWDSATHTYTNTLGNWTIIGYISVDGDYANFICSKYNGETHVICKVNGVWHNKGLMKSIPLLEGASSVFSDFYTKLQTLVESDSFNFDYKPFSIDSLTGLWSCYGSTWSNATEKTGQFLAWSYRDRSLYIITFINGVWSYDIINKHYEKQLTLMPGTTSAGSAYFKSNGQIKEIILDGIIVSATGGGFLNICNDNEIKPYHSAWFKRLSYTNDYTYLISLNAGSGLLVKCDNEVSITDIITYF